MVRFSSLKTDYSPGAHAYSDEAYDFMMSPMTCNPTQVAAHPQHMNLPQPTMPMSSLVTVAPMQFMVLSPCTPQVATASPVPVTSDMPFEESAVGGTQSGLQELLDERRRLEDQRQRLITMSLGSVRALPAPLTLPSATSARTMPAPPPGCWNQAQSAHLNQVQQASQAERDANTSLILRNLPTEFSRDMTFELLQSHGLAGAVDFIYAPVNFSTMETIGYAFVNLVSHEAAEMCRSRLDGFNDWREPCELVLEVVWSEKDQGLSAIIDRHRNSPVMHESVLDQYKPAIYKNGLQLPFPAPTKPVKKPSKHRFRDRTSVC